MQPLSYLLHYDLIADGNCYLAYLSKKDFRDAVERINNHAVETQIERLNSVHGFNTISRKNTKKVFKASRVV